MITEHLPNTGQPDPNKLTEVQIKHWRTVLLGLLGPYANLMRPDEIQKFRDNFQREADKRAAEETPNQTKQTP
jgi:hypothetical protein